MAPEGTQREDDEHVSPILSPILEAGAKVGDGLSPDIGSNVNLVDPENPDEFVAKNPQALKLAKAYLERHPEEMETLAKKVAQNRPMLQKTISFGKALAILGSVNKMLP